MELLFTRGKTERKLDWELHILFQLNYSVILWIYLVIFSKTVNRQGAPGSRKRNTRGLESPLMGVEVSELWNLFNTYGTPFQIPAQLWMLGRCWGISATLNTSMLGISQRKPRREKTWKIYWQRKRGSLDELEKGKARGRRDCASSHLCSPVSYSLFWMRLIFSPLGSINGWPHLFDWKYTSSWFWNIGKYALSSPPSQEVAQCLRPLPLERQKTGSSDMGTGSCAQGAACVIPQACGPSLWPFREGVIPPIKQNLPQIEKISLSFIYESLFF